MQMKLGEYKQALADRGLVWRKGEPVHPDFKYQRISNYQAQIRLMGNAVYPGIAHEFFRAIALVEAGFGFDDADLEASLSAALVAQEERLLMLLAHLDLDLEAIA
jgi:hypothetical protein